ncbi:STAS domain-containing protein [Peribacillus sp. SCS-155]|uniref:STAS domain-containing protein n=1 Tax=Peribacillus sedimenti TaxID=3115297 RepID=UPI003905EF3C
MSSLAKVIDYIIENKKDLADHLVNDIVEKLGINISEEEIASAKNMYEEFLDFLSQSIECDEGSVPDELVEWSRMNGERAASQNARISDIFIRYPDTRIVFADYFLKICLDHHLTVNEYAAFTKRINQMLDISINETVYAFERSTDKIIKEAQSEINKLASPVVPIQKGLAVLPLIGSIDSDRAEHLLNNVVPKLPGYDLESLIIDFSGIVTINADVANHIFRIHDVLRLLGISVMFTGIRAELAAKVVGGGIDFSTYNMYTNVRQAIEQMK